MLRAKKRSVRSSLVAAPVPRLFDQSTAAAYLGLSERQFENRWRRCEMPSPHRVGRRLLWDRVLLDQWVDALSELFVEKNDFGD